MLAKAAVEAAVYAIDKPYTYRLPEDLPARPGQRVTVPFGRSDRLSEAVILSVEEGDETGLKSVVRLLDEEPLLDEGMLRLAAFLRERCFCTFYDAIRAILPAGVWVRSERRYVLAPDGPGWDRLDETLHTLLEAIADLGGSAGELSLLRQFGPERKEDLRLLAKRGYLKTARTLESKTAERTEKICALAVPTEEALREAEARQRRAPVQAEMLRLLASAGQLSRRELMAHTGASAETLRRLAEQGLLTETEQAVEREQTAHARPTAEPPVLNTEQQAAFEGLLAQLRQEKSGAALLYGVTGSGKTAVYLRLIRACLDLGRSAMLLVPEISLTPQLVEQLTAQFGSRVSVLHSRLRIGERYDAWNRVRRGEADVVVGTRSAVFAPLQRPGLLILDEEQEHSYKSESTPRYHARDVALYRGVREGALVLLGSATPSVESMYRARSGQYALYRLRSRYNGQPLPDTEIVDMKQELRAGNGSPLSRRLQQALRENGDRQAILFLNRRGSSRMLVCVDCGHVPQCPNCSVNLTYHRDNGRLMCHYCGFSRPVYQSCPACGGHLKMVGFGTQRVEAELKALLPGKEILRMDADVVRADNPHEAILRRFREKKIPVLVGTQMVTKGLNFENVTLVGVLDADAALYLDSFRAAETAFSMITQVVGRSGRGAARGLALIQTMTPENPVIRLAAAQDYDSFYTLELPLRQLRGCPPFADLITVTFTGEDEERVAAGAQRFRDLLLAALPGSGLTMRVLGPAPAPVVRVSRQYRYRLTLSLEGSRAARQLVAWLLRTFAKEKTSRGVTASADQNSYD